MKFTLILLFTVFFGLNARADEILPVAADSEDLKSFDQSVENAPREKSKFGAAVSAEAKKLKNESLKARRQFGAKTSESARSGSDSGHDASEAAENARSGHNSRGSQTGSKGTGRD